MFIFCVSHFNTMCLLLRPNIYYMIQFCPHKTSAKPCRHFKSYTVYIVACWLAVFFFAAFAYYYLSFYVTSTNCQSVEFPEIICKDKGNCPCVSACDINKTKCVKTLLHSTTSGQTSIHYL